MRKLFALLLMTSSAFGQTVNNATVNIQGYNQNVTIIQSGGNKSATLDLSGIGITAIINQSGPSPQSFNLSVNCGSNCPTTPFVVNQY
jgi:hypothetical protein